jgi:hypothetical protein
MKKILANLLLILLLLSLQLLAVNPSQKDGIKEFPQILSSDYHLYDNPEVKMTLGNMEALIIANSLDTNDQIIINGTPLSDAQITEIETLYGVKPKPGNYWYDSKSGLYGVIGYAAFGFMLPGHEFGELQRSASNGTTSVVVNGRELPYNEWLVWSQVLGYPIQPGFYWFDHLGNAGYEGNPIPTVNLYQTAQQNAMQGQWEGGDNFWSTRFSSGNYDRGNTRGYVSVPGYGPVGYGF